MYGFGGMARGYARPTNEKTRRSLAPPALGRAHWFHRVVYSCQQGLRFERLFKESHRTQSLRPLPKFRPLAGREENHRYGRRDVALYPLSYRETVPGRERNI